MMKGKMLLLPILIGLSCMFPADVESKTTFTDCGGPQKKIAVMSGAVDPDPILYPGSVSVSAAVKVLKDLPAAGLMMHLNLTKLDPYVMPVPCLKNIGSCSYDVCDLIQNHKDQFCPMFPKKVKCGCPMTKESYNLKNAVVALPNFGDIFKKILEGHYKGTIKFEDSSTNTEVACISVTFEIKPSN